MISEDEYLERVVAGIHAVSSNEAEVSWNEKINGRQFDVVVRFRMGTLSYLVLVEVKNQSRPASASDVEAFVTKARDQQADKAVFVTRAGFQDGAIAVAKRHGLDLFKIAFDSDRLGLGPNTSYIVRNNPDYTGDPVRRLKVSERTPTQVMDDVWLTYDDGQRYQVPNESTQMGYYGHRTSLGDGRNLNDLMQTVSFRELATGESRREALRLPKPLSIIPPDDYYYPVGVLVALDVRLTCEMALIISGNVGIEPTAFSGPVIYSNVLTGEEMEFTAGQLPLNMAPLSIGAFYMQFYPLRYLHCAAIKDREVTWDLIESFQLSEKIQGTFTQDVKFGSFYIPIRDSKTLQRLRRRLEDYRASQRQTHHVILAPPSRALRRRPEKPKPLRGR